MKTLTNLDKFVPNCNIFTETPALKHNSNSKLNSEISKNLPKSSDSKTLSDTLESQKSVYKVSLVTDQNSVFHCNDHVRNEAFDTYYEHYLEFKHYMKDIYKVITPRSDLVTNLSNIDVSLQRKIKSLEEEIKVSKKMKIVTLMVISRPNPKLLKTYPSLKIDTVKIPLPIKIR